MDQPHIHSNLMILLLYDLAETNNHRTLLLLNYDILDPCCSPPSLGFSVSFSLRVPSLVRLSPEGCDPYRSMRIIVSVKGRTRLPIVSGNLSSHSPSFRYPNPKPAGGNIEHSPTSWPN